MTMTNTPASTALPSITFTGSEQGSQNGAFLVFISPGQSNPYQTSYASGSTPSTLAEGLAAALGTCSTNGNAMEGVADGATVYLSPCQPGVYYTISAQLTGCSCGQNNGPDFSVLVATTPPTGQLPPVSGAIYDSGTATLTVNGTQIASAAYGANSTAASIASGLASSSSSNSLVNVSYNGTSVLTMTAKDDGSGTDYSYAINFSSSEPSLFSAPSFSGSPNSGSLAGGSGNTVYNWSISSYAPNGDVLGMTDSVMGNWTYTYDDFNRLTSGSASGAPDNGLTLSWTYDRYGNRWSQTATGSGNASAVQPQLTFYGNGVNNNRIDGWSYDAAGNLLYDQINHYTYDAENRIATINGAQAYIYDAEGRRVAKTNSTGSPTSVYVLGLGGEQVTELNGSGGWVHTNVFAAGGRLLATYAGPDDPLQPQGYYFHLTDWLGTERVQTTASGNLEEQCYSYPFGDGLLCTGGPDATEHHFTGKERDVESGLDYFMARYLTSDLGRFMTPDWAATPTTVPYAMLGIPQSLNLYAYGRNNHNSAIDLGGHCDLRNNGCNEPAGMPPNGGMDMGALSGGAMGDPSFGIAGPNGANGNFAEGEEEIESEVQQDVTRQQWAYSGSGIPDTAEGHQQEEIAMAWAIMLVGNNGDETADVATQIYNSLTIDSNAKDQSGNTHPDGLVGGHFNFSIAGVTVNNLPVATPAGSFGTGRTGEIHGNHYEHGDVHNDFANPFSFFGVGGLIHLFHDQWGGTYLQDHGNRAFNY
jgi:RHS repeat-associated protein